MSDLLELKTRTPNAEALEELRAVYRHLERFIALSEGPDDRGKFTALKDIQAEIRSVLEPADENDIDAAIARARANNDELGHLVKELETMAKARGVAE